VTISLAFQRGESQTSPWNSSLGLPRVPETAGVDWDLMGEVVAGGATTGVGWEPSALTFWDLPSAGRRATGCPLRRAMPKKSKPKAKKVAAPKTKNKPKKKK